MNDRYSRWSDVRARGRAVDPRTPAEQAAGKDAARDRQDAYVRGHQLAEMRMAAGITQAELAASLGVSQARVSKIEHGEISGIDVVRAYVLALGGSVDVVATIGDRTWCVALRGTQANFPSGPSALVNSARVGKGNVPLRSHLGGRPCGHKRRTASAAQSRGCAGSRGPPPDRCRHRGARPRRR